MQSPFTNPDPAVQAAYVASFNTSLGLPAEDPQPMAQESFLRGFSWGALVYSYFYFQAMRDRTFAWLSVAAFATVVLLPLILVFPFMARRRAWEYREWTTFNEFMMVQKKWDRAAWVGAVVLIVGGYFTSQLAMTFLLNTLHGINPDLIDNKKGDAATELNKTREQLQDIIIQ
jgi:hypothetical protein